MSLETLLEAAEFLEWSKAKTGKRTTSRETRTSKRAEKFQPYVLSERKKLQSAAKSPNSKSKSAKSAAPTLNILEEASKAANVTKDLLENRDEASFKDIKKCLGTRETHNKLEKNRRAHLKECFDSLREELPYTDERRTSNLATLRTTLRYVDQLNNQQKELEAEKRRMLRLRNNRQAHLTSLRKELKDKNVEYRLEDWLVKAKSTNSTSTATECGTANVEGIQEEEEDNKTGPSVCKFKETAAAPVTSSSEGAVAADQPKADDNVQIVIKALPPLRTKPHLVRPQADNTVTLGGSPQALQMIQQAAIKASNQRLQVQVATPAVATTPAVTTVRTQPTAPVLVKVPTSSGTTQKIIFAPKATAAETQLGQVLLSTANLVVSPAQPAPVSASAITPLTLNLQTGRVITPRPPTLTTPATVVSKSESNLAIAPKQVVFISTAAGDQQQVKAATVITKPLPPPPPPTTKQVNEITLSITQPKPQINAIRPVSMGSMAPLTTLNSGIQPAKPTIITGMLPTTAADGTVSYVPVTLTTKPVPTANPAPPQLLGKNLTFVLPSASSSLSNVALTTPIAPQAPSGMMAPQKIVFHDATSQ